MRFRFKENVPIEPIVPLPSHMDQVATLLSEGNLVVALVVILVTYVLLSRFGTKLLPTNLSVGLLKMDSKGAERAKKSGGWPEYTLTNKKKLSADTMQFTFAIPEKGVSNLPPGKHIMCRALINDERVVRPYTPTLFDTGNRSVTLVVKAYDQAKMSSHLHALPVGATCEMFGPVGSLKYKAGSLDRLVFLCAGTGITPVYAFAKSVLNDPLDATTAVVVLYQNRTEEDVLLREELAVLAAQAKQKGRDFKLVLACSRAGIDFVAKAAAVEGGGGGLATHIKGYLDEAVLAPHLPLPTNAADGGGGSGGGSVKLPRTKVFLCGPGGFNTGITKICVARGYGGEASDAKDRMHVF